MFSKLEKHEVSFQKNGRSIWELEDDFTFELPLNGFPSALKVTVPRGFHTDFASIPRLFWLIFPPRGKWDKAAVIHDFLYSIPECSSFLADAIFREAMAQLKVPLWRRVVMYYAVRTYSVFGFRGRGFSKFN